MRAELAAERLLRGKAGCKDRGRPSPFTGAVTWEHPALNDTATTRRVTPFCEEHFCNLNPNTPSSVVCFAEKEIGNI